MKGQVGQFADVEKLGKQAQQKLKELGSLAAPSAESSKTGGGAQSAGSTIGGLIQDVKARATEAINEAKKQP